MLRLKICLHWPLVALLFFNPVMSTKLSEARKPQAPQDTAKAATFLNPFDDNAHNGMLDVTFFAEEEEDTTLNMESRDDNDDDDNNDDDDDDDSTSGGDDNDDPECDDKQSTRYDPLACWLWNIKVNIPDQSFKKSLVTVKVTALSCSNFVVDSIDSQYVPSNHQEGQSTTNPSVDVAVRGISATCTGKYHVSGGASGNLSLKAVDKDDDKPGISLTFDFESSYNVPNTNATTTTTTTTKKQYWMPSALNTSQCEAALKNSKIHFSGSASAMVANLFSSLIKGAVSSELNSILCPEIKEAVDPTATESIVSAVKTLTKYLSNDNTTSSSSSSSPYDVVETLLNNNPHLPVQRSVLVQPNNEQSTVMVDLEKDTPLLVKSLKWVNHFLDCYYNNPPNREYALEKTDGKKYGAGAAGGKCTNLVTKALKALMSTILDSLAEKVHLPIPKILHKVEFKLPPYGRILLDIQDLHVGGLDELNALSLLSPIVPDDKTVQLSAFHTQLQTGAGLNVTADVNITVFPIPGGIVHGDPLHEAFHVHLNVSSLDALGVVDVALKSDQFQQIQIGTVLDALPPRINPHTNPQNATVDRKCLVDTLQSLQVKEMELEALVTSVTLVPRFNANTSEFLQRRRLWIMTEKLERDLDEVINHGMELVLTEYQPLLTDAAAGFVKTALVSMVNDWIDRKVFNRTDHDRFFTPRLDTNTKTTTTTTELFPLEGNHNVCRSGDDGAAPQLVNFTNLGYLKKLNEIINKPSSLASINKAIDKLAAKAGRHHDISIMDSLMAMTGALHDIPGVSVKLRDLQIDNAGSINHIDLLSPQLDGLHLRNGFSMGIENNSTEASTLPTIHASIGLVYHPRNLEGTLNLTVSLGEIFLDGGQILRFDMTRLRRLSLIELLSHGHCVLVPFKGHEIYNNHNVSRIGTLFANATVSVVGDSTFENFTTFMDTTTYPSAASLITAIIGWTMDTLQMTANSFARSSFDQAEGYCTGGKKFGYDDHPPILDDGYVDPWILPVVYVLLGLLGGAQVVFLCFYYFYRKRRADRSRRNGDALREEQLTYENGEHETFLEDDEDKDKEVCASETLVQSKALSAFSRQAVPVFIVGTIVLLLSSNISTGATVDLQVALNESSAINLPAIFEFSLWNTAKDMWKAGIYALFFLVLIMSGIWPYTKLLLMLGSWIAPTNVLNARTRERLLLALDALGKFALIDFLLFVLMMVAFRYHLDVTDQISVDVFVTPETGFYSFLAATCFSLVIGHFMVFCHRLSEMRHLSPRHDESIAQFKESVFGHKYVIGYSNEGAQRLRLSRRFCGLLLFMMVSAVVLLSVGITQKSFKFEIGAVAGDLLGDQRTRYYSLVSLGSSLRRSVKNPSSMGIIVLEVIFYFYAVVTPFTCLGILFILLVCPMTLSTQRTMLALAEITNAWSAVEVFVIAIVASLLEISTFASFIVGHRCDLIKKILKEYFESAISDESDATCFTVRSELGHTSWILVTGVLVNSMIVSVLLRFAHCSVAERIESEMESSLGERSTDALDPEESHRPKTIAGLLFCGCFRSIVFENAATTALRQRYGYLPQSTDTYSVAAEVNWQEDASHFTGITSPVEGPASPFDGPTSPFDGPDALEDQQSGPAAANQSVLDTIRNAFD